MTCAAQDCMQPVGRNGVACHDHFTDHVPAFLARAFFASRDEFTKRWLGEQVRHAVRGEPWSA